MTINKTLDAGKLTVALEGRLDTMTAPAFEAELGGLDGITELVIDMNAVEYISSAGLRVLLASQKKMTGKGSMVLKNVPEAVNEVFDITGFSDILTIE